MVPRHKNCPQQFQIGSVTTVPPGLSVRHQPTETGQEKIVISRLPETATRAYVVRVEVICTHGRDTINSIVFVK